MPKIIYCEPIHTHFKVDDRFCIRRVNKKYGEGKIFLGRGR